MLPLLAQVQQLRALPLLQQLEQPQALPELCQQLVLLQLPPRLYRLPALRLRVPQQLVPQQPVLQLPVLQSRAQTLSLQQNQSYPGLTLLIYRFELNQPQHQRKAEWP